MTDDSTLTPFELHLDTCHQCFENEWQPCDIGKSLLDEAGINLEEED